VHHTLVNDVNTHREQTRGIPWRDGTRLAPRTVSRGDRHDLGGSIDQSSRTAGKLAADVRDLIHERGAESAHLVGQD
jgi:hypothetical protein